MAKKNETTIGRHFLIRRFVSLLCSETKMKQAQIKGFMKKKAKRDEIKLQYEYDIPEANPNLAPEDRP